MSPYFGIKIFEADIVDYTLTTGYNKIIKEKAHLLYK
jgi:hypothetical protein